MDRNFFGLGSKIFPITVKEETGETSKNSAPNKGINWSFSNNYAVSSQFQSFKPSQEDKHEKSRNYHLPHLGSFMPSSSVANGRMLSNSNQNEEAILVSMSKSNLQSHYAQGRKNLISNNIKSQPLVGVPIMAPPISILHAPSSIVGTTNIRSSSKPLESPAQLTMFYADSVCVYNDISPEKAKAIMLLAGDGSSMPQTHQQVINHGRALVDSSAMSHSFMPTMSYLNPEAGSNTNGLGASTYHNSQTNASNIHSSMATNVMAPTVALPQSRKASLARFLEKRKERVTSVSPYSSTDCRTPMSECISSSLSSAN